MKYKKYKNLLTLSLAPILTVPVIVANSCSSTKEEVKKIVSLYDSINNKIIINGEIDIKKISSIENLYIVNNLTNNTIEFITNPTYNDNTKIFDAEISSKNLNISNLNLSLKDKKSSFSLDMSEVKSLESFDLNTDKQYFFNLIKDMSSNNIPTIIDSRNASLIVQQNFYISLVDYFNNYNKIDSKDKTITIIQQNLLDNNRFNLNVLRTNNICNEIKNIDELNLNNVSNFNIVKSSLNNFESFNNETYYSDLLKILNQLNIKTKIDFVIPDLNLLTMLSKYNESKSNNYLNLIFKYANRIIVTSDGSAHSSSFLPYIYDKINKVIPKTKEEIITILKDFQDGKTSVLKFEDIIQFLLLKNFETTKGESKFNFIHFVNYDANVKNSIRISDTKMWNETSFSTNFVEYANLIDDLEIRNKYLQTYSKLFLQNEINSLQDILISGYKNYDPNKRNAIFLGSSLFRPLSNNVSDITPENFSRLQVFPQLRKYVQEVMKEFLAKFPASEYNIIFKLHPNFANSNDPENNIAINYVKLLTNNEINDPIIISSSIPLETLISNDYYLSTSGSSNLNFIFRSNQQYKAHEWTTFFGFQAASTTIHTTRLFYQSTFNLTKEQVAQLIPFSNFPIPTKFHIIERMQLDVNENTNLYDKNKKEVEKIFKYFCPSLSYDKKELDKYDSLVINF